MKDELIIGGGPVWPPPIILPLPTGGSGPFVPHIPTFDNRETVQPVQIEDVEKKISDMTFTYYGNCPETNNTCSLTKEYPEGETQAVALEEMVKFLEEQFQLVISVEVSEKSPTSFIVKVTGITDISNADAEDRIVGFLLGVIVGLTIAHYVR